MIKRLISLSFFCALFAGLPVSVVYAETEPDPGCSPEMMTVLQHQADAIRARNHAYTIETLNRDNSTLYLTCFDQAVAYSARIGQMFSDRMRLDPLPADTVVWREPQDSSGGGGGPRPLDYPDWGLQHSLILDLNKVVRPIMDEIAGNFRPQPEGLSNTQKLAKAVKEKIDEVKRFQDRESARNANPPSPQTVYNQLIRRIDDLVTGFPDTPWPELPGRMNQYDALMQAAGAVVAAIVRSRRDVLIPIFYGPNWQFGQAPTGGINGLITGVIPTNPDSRLAAEIDLDNCHRLDVLWSGEASGNSDPVTGPRGTRFYPPEGEYYALTPYYSLKTILRTPPSSLAGATSDFRNDLSTTNSNTVLATALQDLTTGNLSRPRDENPIWKSSPRFMDGDDPFGTEQIICAMHRPETECIEN